MEAWSDAILIAIIGSVAGLIGSFVKAWLDNQNTDRQADLDASNSEFAILRGVIAEIRTDLDAERLKRRTLSERLLQAESDQRESQQKIRRLESERREMSRRLLAFETDCAAKDRQIAAYQTEISSLNTKIAAYQSEVTGLNARIASLENELHLLRALVDQHKIPLPGDDECPDGDASDGEP